MYDINKIQEVLPHRYPFLLIDKIIDFTPDQSAHAIKCVTINEPFFQGHFPGRPMMPGVLIVEAIVHACRGRRCLSSKSTQECLRGEIGCLSVDRRGHPYVVECLRAIDQCYVHNLRPKGLKDIDLVPDSTSQTEQALLSLLEQSPL